MAEFDPATIDTHMDAAKAALLLADWAVAYTQYAAAELEYGKIPLTVERAGDRAQYRQNLDGIKKALDAARAMVTRSQLGTSIRFTKLTLKEPSA